MCYKRRLFFNLTIMSRLYVGRGMVVFLVT